jgi:acetyl esterase/lipase
MMAMLNLAAASSAKTVIPVWPHLKVPPGLRKVKKEIQGSNGLVEIRPIRLPTLTEFPAPKKLRNGCAIVICPGGAYYLEAMALEGYRVARRFNRAGISCYVLRYRLPDGKLPRSGVPWPLQDVRRAIQIVKSHAKAWHINRHDVGVMGFSAGGSVASLAGVHWIPANPQSPDPVDHYSSRPRFMVLGYPVISMIPGITHPGSHNNLLGQHPALRTEQYFSSELNVDALTPPAFIFYAHDDHAVSHANEKLFYAALRRQRIPAKLVEFRHGGHGFGLGRPGTDSVKWPAMCIQWLRKMKFIPSSAELQLFRRSGHQWSRRIDG